MTIKQARIIRELRDVRRFTWGAVGEACAGPDDDWAEGQYVGRLICERAAKLLGEDPSSAPWI